MSKHEYKLLDSNLTPEQTYFQLKSEVDESKEYNLFLLVLSHMRNSNSPLEDYKVFIDWLFDDKKYLRKEVQY